MGNGARAIACVAIGVLIFSHASSGQMVRIAAPTGSEEAFRISEKSSSVVARVGETLELSCRTTSPWNLCGWRQPSGVWCDRLSTSKYASSCFGNDRVRYKRPQPASIPPGAIGESGSDPLAGGRECAIIIVDLAPEDSGEWTCNVKEDLRSAEDSYETVELIVAAPYAIILEPADMAVVVLDGNSSESTRRVECTAVGGGAVDPKLEWRVDNARVEDGADESGGWVETWEEDHSDGSKLVHSALTLVTDDGELNPQLGLEVGDTVDLRCVSRQLFPNGSAIYETMARTSVTVVSNFDAKAAARNGEEVGEAGSTTAGMVIAILITLFVLFALIFICYAQKAKKFCYAPGVYPKIPHDAERVPRDTSGTAPNHANQTQIAIGGSSNSNQGAGAGDSTEDEGESLPPARLSLSIRETHGHPIPETPIVTPGAASSPPPSAPPMAVSDPPAESESARNMFLYPTSTSSPQQPEALVVSEERLKELITSAPPTTPPTVSKELKIPTYRDFTVPQPTGLTEGLTAPRLTQVKRRNDYVKNRPTSTTSSTNRPDSETSLSLAPPPDTDGHDDTAGRFTVSAASQATQQGTEPNDPEENAQVSNASGLEEPPQAASGFWSSSSSSSSSNSSRTSTTASSGEEEVPAPSSTTTQSPAIEPILSPPPQANPNPPNFRRSYETSL